MTKFNPHQNVYKDMESFEIDYWWYRSLRHTLRYYLNQYNPKIILDAGCGTGANISFINNSDLKIYGLDISREAVTKAKKKGIKNLSIGNISHLPYENNFFDLIYCLDVLGNLDDEKTIESFREFRRCLKKGGILIIQTAALPYLYSSHDKYWDIGKRYYLEELVLKLEEEFSILKKSYRHFILFPLIFAIKLKNKFHKNKSSGDFEKLPNMLNELLFNVMRFENYLLRYLSLPIGSSVFVIAKKN